MRTTLLAFIALGFASLSVAQTPSITPNGIVNVASYAYAGLPSGGIAPGSMFVAFGSNLGPAVLAQASAFPLPTSLGGTSVKVTAGGTTYTPVLNYTSAGQITGILPSAVPPGTATMTVTYNGATSAGQTFTVTANSFGTFATNAGGTGPGSITNAAGKVFTATAAANPNEAAVIYGTGLGAISGNDGALPTVVDMTSIPVEVFVGGTKATVSYRGRSGCCAGVDQITFTVPSVAGLTGCAVPITVKINNVVSNVTTIPIAATGGRICSDPGGPSNADLQRVASQGSASIGVVTLLRTTTTLTLPFVGTQVINADVGSAAFQRYTTAQLNATANPYNAQTPGTCTVSWTKGGNVAATAITPTSLDAGASISVAGPGGTKTMARASAGGLITYSGVFSDLASLTPSTFLNSGSFTISGAGGPGVGAFTAVLKNPASVNWTNQNITSITRANGQLITWSGGDAGTTILIGGVSSTGNAADSIGATFSCFAKATDGQFTIPAQVLLSLPASQPVQGVEVSALYVGAYSAPVSFTATGLDNGYAFGVVNNTITLGYK